MQANRLMAWVVVFLASLFLAYELIQLHMLNAIAPMLLKDLNLTGAKFGALSSTYLLADVIFLLPAGIILDRFETRRVILTALGLCIAGTVGFALSQNFWQACVSHFFSGIGNAFCFLSCMMLVSKWFEEKKHAFMMGFVVTVGLFGGVIAQLPFSYLAEILSWRMALLTDAFIGLGLFGLIYLFVKDPEIDSFEEEEQFPFLEGLKASLLNSKNIYAGLYTGFMNLPLMIIGALFGSLFLTQVHNIPLASASFIISTICMGTIVGSLLVGYISDKFHVKTPLMLLGSCLSLIVFGLILVVPAPSQSALMTLFFLLGLFTSSQVLGYPTITEHNPKHLTGTSMGIASLIIMGLPMLLQPLVGKLLDFGWDKTMVDHVPIYSLQNFIMAFSVFPIGFVISFFIAKKLEASPKKLKMQIE
jgi:MFS family permease